MTALHPSTRASEPDADGKRHSEHNPGSLGKDAVDPMNWPPGEVPDGHLVLKDVPRFHVRGPGVAGLPAHRRAVREGPDQEAPPRARRTPGA
ncbi:hypothetical protein ACE1SV_00580 [Streptomyces sennicomposti]